MNVVLVHGWLSTPDRHWFPWLKRELKKRGFNVIAPQMPNPIRPNKKLWVEALRETLSALDPRETVLLGHSLGVPTILYCLQEHRGLAYPRTILIGGFARKIPLLDDVIDGYDMNLDLRRIKPKSLEWTCIHGNNDPIVPFKEGRWLAKRLRAEFIVEKGRGHLTSYRGVKELPSALGAVSGEVVESFRRNAVIKEGSGMKLRSALDSVVEAAKRNHPALRIDPMIFLRTMILREVAKRRGAKKA